MTVKNFEHLGDLRFLDLVAKTSKVNMKDTLRCMIAMRLVLEHFGQKIEDMVGEDYEFSLERPSPENAAACEQAYAEIESKVAVSEDQFTLNALQAINHFR